MGPDRAGRIRGVPAGGGAALTRPGAFLRAPEEASSGWTSTTRLSISPLLAAEPATPSGAQVAQLVEHATENRSVGGSIPPLGTTSSSHVVSCYHP